MYLIWQAASPEKIFWLAGSWNVFPAANWDKNVAGIISKIKKPQLPGQNRKASPAAMTDFCQLVVAWNTADPWKTKFPSYPYDEKKSI